MQSIRFNSETLKLLDLELLLANPDVAINKTYYESLWNSDMLSELFLIPWIIDTIRYLIILHVETASHYEG